MQMKKGHVCIFDKNKKEGFAGDISTLAEATSPRPLSLLGYVLFDSRVFLRDFIMKMPII